MKKFSELSFEEFEQIINRSKKLRDELNEYIMDCEMIWLSEKLDCVKDSLSDWCVGFYEQNYTKVKDWEGFFEGVKVSAFKFGCSERMTKKISHVGKLKMTNLFEFECKALKAMWWLDEIYPTIKYVEDASYELYCGKIGEKCRSYLESFLDLYEDYLYDEQDGMFYQPQKLDAA